MLKQFAAEEQQLIEQLQRRWMVGSKDPLSEEQLPRDWRPLLQDQSAERKSLLALAILSQHQALLLTPEADSDLKAKPDLPALDLPSIHSHLRPLFRRNLDNIKKLSGIELRHLLQLLLQRNCTAHPADWLPSPKDEDSPSVYWPWCRWVSSELAGGDDASTESLTTENWDSFYPAQRLSILRELRHQDRHAARELIYACVHRETAEKRLKIIETLAINLSQDDGEFLQSLTQDRSQKISSLASQYLARLGLGQPLTTGTGAAGEDSAAQAKELAEGYELKKVGLIRARYKLVPRKLKSKKQQAVRSELLQNVSFREFASALGMEEHSLAANWQFTENRDHDNQCFIISAANTMPDEHMAVLLESLLAQIESSNAMLSHVKLLLPRLHEHNRAALMRELLNNKAVDFDFVDGLAFIDAPLASLSWKEFSKTRAWKKLTETLHEEVANKGYVDNHHAVKELIALGLLLPADIADAGLQAIVALGVLRADPALDSLKLNIELTQSN